MQVTGNTWEVAAGRTGRRIGQIGEEYSGYLAPGGYAPMVVDRRRPRGSFRDTGLRDGSVVAGRHRLGLRPRDSLVGRRRRNVEVLAHSPIPTSRRHGERRHLGRRQLLRHGLLHQPDSQAGRHRHRQQRLDRRPAALLERSIRTAPTPTMTLITNNILRVFGQGPAGALEPATSNLTSISPAGS